MNKGSEMEGIIRKAIELEYNTDIVPICFQCEEYPFMICSTDGICKGNLWEHKLTRSQEHGIRPYWYSQIQYMLYITDLKQCILTVTHLATKTYKHYIIKRNNLKIEQIKDAVIKFYKQIKEA